MSQQSLNSKTKLLEAHDLTMRFGGVTALDSLNLHVNEGEVLGLLGPNGSGKTTTIQMLLGTLSLSGGVITYFGKDLQNINLAEAAMLAGIPNRPGAYNPIKSLEAALKRQKLVLSMMLKNNFITQNNA